MSVTVGIVADYFRDNTVAGAETAVLRSGARMFSEYRPSIYLALHAERQRNECRSPLNGWGYRLFSLEKKLGLGLDSSSEWLTEPA